MYAHLAFDLILQSEREGGMFSSQVLRGKFKQFNGSEILLYFKSLHYVNIPLFDTVDMQGPVYMVA